MLDKKIGSSYDNNDLIEKIKELNKELQLLSC